MTLEVSVVTSLTRFLIGSTIIGEASMSTMIRRLTVSLLMAAVFYWIMTLIFSSMQGRLEAQLARGDR